ARRLCWNKLRRSLPPPAPTNDIPNLQAGQAYIEGGDKIGIRLGPHIRETDLRAATQRCKRNRAQQCDERKANAVAPKRSPQFRTRQLRSRMGPITGTADA